MSEVTIWHNPRCSKSRQTLALLREKGCKVTERRYLDDPPSRDELREALCKLDIAAISLVRRSEPAFRELGLTAASDESELIAAMAGTPQLIERPIVFASGKAAIGRPPDAILAIL